MFIVSADISYYAFNHNNRTNVWAFCNLTHITFSILDCFTSGDQSQFDPQLDYVDFNRYNINDDTEDYIRRYISPIEGEPGIRNDDNEMIYNYIVRHPSYNHNTTDFDYALIVLDETEAIDSIPNLGLNFNIDRP